MEPIIALLALVAQISIPQDAIIATLEKKGIISRANVDAQMPKTEDETGRKFAGVKDDFFELWSEFDEEDGADSARFASPISCEHNRFFKFQECCKLSGRPLLGGRTIGSTSDSGSDYPGSSPGLPANL